MDSYNPLVRSAAAYLLLLIGPVLLYAEPDAETRVQWEMNNEYNGPHQDAFFNLRHEVPILMRQTMINIAVKTGLNFNEGWTHPLIIGFVDEAPGGAENVLAYVAIESNGTDIRQVLNVNLSAYSRDNFSFDKVFAHELVHAMVTDSVGTDASVKLPTWFHEGLAVYAADQGDQMVRSYVTTYQKAPERILNGLEGPHGPLDYAEDYLAFKYIVTRHSVNAFHNFIREVVRRKGEIPQALETTSLEGWDSFLSNSRKFAEDEVHRVAGGIRGEKTEKPY